MNTKKCSKCGWVYPITHSDRRCRFCGTLFEYGFCLTCGKYAKLHPYNGRCADCFTKVNTEYTTEALERRREETNEALAQWLLKTNALKMRTLSEKDWLAVCTYFNKCAYCASEEISARAFFISYKLGGRYTAWNVIPVCETCALRHNTKSNPFAALDKEVLDRIVKYLSSKMQEARNDRV